MFQGVLKCFWRGLREVPEDFTDFQVTFKRVSRRLKKVISIHFSASEDVSRTFQGVSGRFRMFLGILEGLQASGELRALRGFQGVEKAFLYRLMILFTLKQGVSLSDLD